MDFKIEPCRDGMTVRDFIRNNLKLSRRELTRLKLFDEGIMLNGGHITVRAVLKAGDILTLALDDRENDENTNLLPTNLPLDIIFENEDFILLNKPPFMPTHPSHGHFDDTLANALAYYFQSRNIPFIFRAINRLDCDTSGVVLVAKNKHSCSLLSKEQEEHRICKKYIAAVHGRLCDDIGSIVRNIKREKESIITRVVCPDNEGDYARTDYRLICTNSDSSYSLYEVTPVTGRTHQIRVHFSSLGCPLIGDSLYGSPDEELISRHALHASSLSFLNVSNGKKIIVKAAVPSDILRLLKMLFPESAYLYSI